jgi:peptidoglycan/LPS O-acetylase OafA/YrhL
MKMNWSTPRLLNGETSIFLDAIRFVAAFTVFLAHGRAIWYPEKERDLVPSHLAHGAVVIFFVLSGFVIAHTTTNKNRGLKEYIAARFSRLYSIFFPALIITIICSILLYYLNPGVWQQYDTGKTFFRYFVSSLFCNEIWLFSSAPKLNGPIWSLSYEFWYYVIFGCFFYRRKGLRGLVAPLAGCLIAGPKILVMMFIWLTGWVVYHLPRPSLKPAVAWLLITILLLLSVYLMLYLPAMPFEVNTWRFLWADQFLTDWIVGLFVGSALFILPEETKVAVVNRKAVKFFRRLGDMTYPIYVLHFPLLVVAKALLPDTYGRSTQLGIGLVFVFFTCSIIGAYLEAKRIHWNTFFSKTVEKYHFKIADAKT